MYKSNDSKATWNIINNLLKTYKKNYLEIYQTIIPLMIILVILDRNYLIQLKIILYIIVLNI